VYFPRGQKRLKSIVSKFRRDAACASQSGAEGIAFVTNQELKLAEREKFKNAGAPILVELFHLERITAILDTPGMAATRAQFLDIEADISPPIQLGGHGGRGPGAGGGGGGAMGPESKGGPGGRGGNINLHGAPGEGPGAGGGGAGAIGVGALGAEGGGGGEYLAAMLSPEQLAGVDHFDVQIGKGGVNGPGEDTILNACNASGHVLYSIRAKGGKVGAPAHVPPLSRLPTEDDIRAGLKVTGMLVAEFARCGPDGLWTIVGAGYDWFQPNSNPFRISLPLWLEIETGTIAPATTLDLSLVVLTPNGIQVHEQKQRIVVEASLVRRCRFGTVLEFTGSDPGLWQVHVLAGREVIGRFPFEIRAPSSVTF
jgi:hypothetical protein